MNVSSNCLNVQHSAISASFVTRQALLTPALQTARQNELDGSSIRFTLLNRFESVYVLNGLFPAALHIQLVPRCPVTAGINVLICCDGS